MSQRIGLMGGMFDPVHYGHLQAACAAQSLCALDEVRMIPCGNPVHRDTAQVSASQRCDMLALALEDYPGLVLDRRECESAALSRTFDTLTDVHEEMPEASLFFIMGLDAFLAMNSWYRWPDILQLANLIVMSRPGYQYSPDAFSGDQAEVFSQAINGRLCTTASELEQAEHNQIFLAEVPTADLSSTQVRQSLEQGESLSEYLPACILEYIHLHQLYR